MIAQTVMERMKHIKEIMSNNAGPPPGTNKTQIQKITNEAANKIQPQAFNPFMRPSPLSIGIA